MKHLTNKLVSLLKWVKITALILPMLALMLTAGCVTHPSASTVQSWPAQPPAGYAMLMMYWTKTRWDQEGGGPSVYIDDVKAFNLHINHYTWIYVRAGQHNFSTMWGFKMFGWNPLSGLNMKKDIPFKDGKNYYLKLNCWDKGFYVDRIYVQLQPVTEEIAKKEAATCWFSKPLVSQIDDLVTNQSEANISSPTNQTKLNN